jgi:hypothetical protein
MTVATIDEIVAKMKQNPNQVRQVLWAIERLGKEHGKGS